MFRSVLPGHDVVGGITVPELADVEHMEGFILPTPGSRLPGGDRGGYPTGPVAEGGKVVELLRNHPHLCGDLSAGSGHNAISRDPEFGYWFLTEFQDRLCFGTDVCAPRNRDDVLVWLADFLKDALANGKITQEVFDKVAFRNAQGLLGLGGTAG